MEVKVSAHAAKRYVERFMDSITNMDKYISRNHDEIVKNINNIVNKSNLLISGLESYKEGYLDVYLYKNIITMITSKKSEKDIQIVVTIYKIDLKCGDKLNNLYIEEMLSKINNGKNKLQIVQNKINERIEDLEETINKNERLIEYYKMKIEILKSNMDACNSTIKTLKCNITEEDEELKSLINSFIRDTVF